MTQKLHRIAYYQLRWSGFDQIEECQRPKFCVGCEYKHPFCEINGRIIREPDTSVPVGK